MNFSKKHLEQIKAHGLTPERVEDQVQTFREGIYKMELINSATVGEGISRFADAEVDSLVSFYEQNFHNLKILKFVPASGAASRMFKALYQFLETYNAKEETTNAYINKKKGKVLRLFFVGLEKFPFYDELSVEVRKLYPDYEQKSKDERRWCIVNALLSEDGLNFGNLPKGLVPFHKYKEHGATPYEEHLFEATKYASPRQKANIHFTISEEHQHKFNAEYDRIETIVSEKTNTKFTISESYQKSNTDTIAVNMDNTPFKDHNGNFVFRPGGHGALIENLNDQDADIIFIKNIDNVVIFEYEEEVAVYKKMIGGLLLRLREESFNYLKRITGDVEIAQKNLQEIVRFLKENFNTKFSEDFDKFSQDNKIDYLKKQLDRPIRVCGMVKNEGEPGGGPFWVKNETGQISLQIVESVQIDMKDKQQKRIVKDSTHFNPVDLVCSVTNYKGKPFNLLNYVDEKTGIITKKTIDGKPVKALELPGLWNGAMAHWNTIFVEVPLVTFNPVKTVSDLLKPTHQLEN